MMKKALLPIFIFGLISTAAFAQLEPQFSQYFQNSQMINPATTGIEDYTDLKMGYRQQWSGFDNAPTSYYINVNGNLSGPEIDFTKDFSIRVSDPSIYNEVLERMNVKKKIKHGLGGFIIADHIGPFQNYGGYANYAFHYPISRTLYLSVGAKLGVVNKRMDESELRVRNEVEDQTFRNFKANNSSDTYVDGGLGAMIYGERFYIGYSNAQIFQNRILNDGVDFDNRLRINHFAMAGYDFQLTDRIELRPSTLVKYINPQGITYNVNAKVRYNEAYWVGVGYRGDDAVIGMLGVTINNFVNFSYSYDYTTSGLSDYSSNTHELVLGLMLNNVNASPQYMW